MKDFDDFMKTIDPDEIGRELLDGIEESREQYGEDNGEAGVVNTLLFAVLRRYHEWLHS